MSTDGTAPFAGLLKRYRAGARLSQEELAERAGLSVRAISALERGVNLTPRSATLRLLIEALELTEQEQAAFEAAARREALAPPIPLGRLLDLPPRLTSFIGREREVEVVRQTLMRPDVRLLSLTGPGGAGKTRLALRSVEAIATRFPDGVAFVDLAPVFDAELVPHQIASVLGIAETPHRSLLDSLEAHLRERRMLLVLDNFEQVVLAGPFAAHLLGVAPGLKLLVTSRVALRVSGEYEYQVPPLAVPNLDQPAVPEQVGRYEAVQLFLARARAVRSGFALVSENAPAVAELCRRLDGLPLAIELAAARVRLLSPQAMLPRLGDSLALLTGGPQDMPVRQQTLRATLDWSYCLLAGPARRLLPSLAVFASDFTLDAAEAVCRSEDGSEVLEGIATLVEASLLAPVERASEAGDRYRMLQTVREYALLRLGECEHAETVHRRHAEYYLDMAETASLEIEGQRQAAWLHRLEAEHDDLRAALTWCRESGERGMLLRLRAGLWVFWAVNGHLSEGRRWLETVLAADHDRLTPVRARALEGAGHLAWKQGDNAGAKVRLEESWRAYEQLGDTRGVASVLQDLGATLLAQGERAEARAYFERALEMQRALADKVGVSYALRELGLLALWEGDYDRARTLTEESLKLQREAGDQQGATGTLSRLGMVAMAQGDHEQAWSLQEQSLRLARELQAKSHIPVPLSRMGMIAWKRGDTQQDTRLLGESLLLWRELGSWPGIAHTQTSLAVVALEEGRDTEAISLAREGLESYMRVGADEGVAESLEVIAAAMVRRQPSCSAQLFGAAAALRGVIGAAPSFDRPDYESYIAAARAALGEDAFAAAWAEGAALPTQQAVQSAVGECSTREQE